MGVHFLSDEDFRVTAVQVPIELWKDLERKAEAFDLGESIRKGLEQVEQIEDGKITAKSFDRLLGEL